MTPRPFVPPSEPIASTLTILSHLIPGAVTLAVKASHTPIDLPLAGLERGTAISKVFRHAFSYSTTKAQMSFDCEYTLALSHHFLGVTFIPFLVTSTNNPDVLYYNIKFKIEQSMRLRKAKSQVTILGVHKSLCSRSGPHSRPNVVPSLGPS
jgi:hypothetical protein